MGNALKILIETLCFKIYSVGKRIDYEQKSKWSEKNLIENATIGIKTQIEECAIIQNTFKDPKRIIIGENSHILGHLMLFGHGGQITIGDYCYIGEKSRIWSALNICIGNRVLISHNVNIHDNISHPLDSQERHEDFVHIRKIGFQKTNHLREKAIFIEDDVWIGFNCTIHKGVRIGRGAIIGSNTIITKNVEPFSVVVGNPSKIIKKTS